MVTVSIFKYLLFVNTDSREHFNPVLRSQYNVNFYLLKNKMVPYLPLKKWSEITDIIIYA